MPSPTPVPMMITSKLIIAGRSRLVIVSRLVVNCGQGLRSTAQRRCGEIHAEALAPDRHRAVFREVEIRSNLVILVANVAFRAPTSTKPTFLTVSLSVASLAATR
jgi:hypothetical protein